METDIRPIAPFCCEQIERTKLAREWRSWKTSLEFYFEAHGIQEQKMKRAKMLYLGGTQLQRVFINLPDTDKVPLVAWEKRWYDTAIEKLDEFFQPVRQDTLERHRLREMKQQKDERFAHFVLRLRQQVVDCGFDKHPPEVAKVLMEITLIDVIVEGCSSMELRKRILKEDQSLEQIEALGAMLEGVEEQVKGFSTDQKVDEKVFQVMEKEPLAKRPSYLDKTVCFNCGYNGHWAKSPQCPAKNQICRNCRQKGHFKTVCRNKKRLSFKFTSDRQDKKVRVVQAETEATDRDTSNEVKEKRYYAFYSENKSNIIDCCIGGVKWKILVDSGADCNLISTSAWEKLKEARIVVYSSMKGCGGRTLRAYGSQQPLNVLGSFVADIKIGQKTTKADFFVVQGGQQCLLGDKTSKELGVLKVGLDIQNVEETWKPFAKISGIQINIQMDPEVKPVFQPLRKVPIPLEADLKNAISFSLQTSSRGSSNRLKTCETKAIQQPAVRRLSSLWQAKSKIFNMIRMEEFSSMLGMQDMRMALHRMDKT
ncbi:uncharacterized protein LOC134207062 [Armigeres subalbatus]|uniref:uncharacterized protein LOC134207062 n=1 Tax=Armigeres subalbatus TaxID=124917 RepID=UPI002ECFFDD0